MRGEHVGLTTCRCVHISRRADTSHLAECAVVVQDRAEGNVQDVGVDVRSDKCMARTSDEDDFFKDTRMKAPLMSSLES